MKRIIIILCLIIPSLTFAQLSKKEKKEIKSYTLSMCDCVDDLINTLHPTTVEYLTIMFNDGEEKANEFLNSFMSTASESEISKVTDSFTAMSADSFGEKIEACDDKDAMESKVARDIDNQVGEAHEYFLQMLEEGKTCFMLKNFYLIGTAGD